MENYFFSLWSYLLAWLMLRVPCNMQRNVRQLTLGQNGVQQMEMTPKQLGSLKKPSEFLKPTNSTPSQRHHHSSSTSFSLAASANSFP